MSCTASFNYVPPKIEAFVFCPSSGGASLSTSTGIGGYEAFCVVSEGAMERFGSLRFTRDLITAEGYIQEGKTRRTVELVRDCYILLGFKKDYFTLWKGGREVFTRRASSFALPHLVAKAFTSHLTDIKNHVDCDTCREKRSMVKTSFVLKAPEHLIVALKRMSYGNVDCRRERERERMVYIYREERSMHFCFHIDTDGRIPPIPHSDWKTNRAFKNMQHVHIPVLLTLPQVPEDMVVLSEYKKEKEGGRVYGLYAIVVHSGISANTGHYFSYCRSSSSSFLHLNNDPAAPWIKFNDSKVTRTTYESLMEDIHGRVGDTSYLMFYKKMSSLPLPEGRGDAIIASTHMAPSSPSHKKEIGDLTASPSGTPHIAISMDMYLYMRVVHDNSHLYNRMTYS